MSRLKTAVYWFVVLAVPFGSILLLKDLHRLRKLIRRRNVQTERPEER